MKETKTEIAMGLFLLGLFLFILFKLFIPRPECFDGVSIKGDVFCEAKNCSIRCGRFDQN